MLKNIDEFMRSFDTTHAGKKLETPMTKDVDVLVYDVQDVGTRIYTFKSTMAYAMEAAPKRESISSSSTGPTRSTAWPWKAPSSNIRSTARLSAFILFRSASE